MAGLKAGENMMNEYIENDNWMRNLEKYYGILGNYFVVGAIISFRLSELNLIR
jgi:hypothetical protein